MYQDRTIICVECGAPFVFSVRDQEYYETQGFTHPPKRCRPCRTQKKSQFDQGDGEKVWHDITCDDCGAPARVPFKPSQGRPVYCHPCRQARVTQ